jgi:hypothetical protein
MKGVGAVVEICIGNEDGLKTRPGNLQLTSNIDLTCRSSGMPGLQGLRLALLSFIDICSRLYHNNVTGKRATQVSERRTPPK